MKNIITWITKNIILVGFIVCAIIIIVLWFQLKNVNKKFDIQSVELMSRNDSVKEYRTKAGDAYFKINSVSVEANVLRQSVKAMDIDLKELRATKVKLNDIIAVQKLQLLAAGHINANVRDSIIHDTIPGNTSSIVQKINWTNNYLTLNGVIKDKVFDADYTYLVNLKLISEKKGKLNIVTGIIDDPYAKIITGSQLIITPTSHWYQKWWIWGIGGMVGGYFIAK